MSYLHLCEHPPLSPLWTPSLIPYVNTLPYLLCEHPPLSPLISTSVNTLPYLLCEHPPLSPLWTPSLISSVTPSLISYVNTLSYLYLCEHPPLSPLWTPSIISPSVNTIPYYLYKHPPLFPPALRESGNTSRVFGQEGEREGRGWVAGGGWNNKCLLLHTATLPTFQNLTWQFLHEISLVDLYHLDVLSPLG